MGDLIIIFVKVLDPIIFIILLITLFIFFSKKTIVLAAIFVAMASETIISQASPGRNWGDRLVHGLIASHIQSILAYYLIKFFKKKKNNYRYQYFMCFTLSK